MSIILAVAVAHVVCGSSSSTLHNHALLLVLRRSLARDLTVPACCCRPVSAMPAPPGCRRRLPGSSLALTAAVRRCGLSCGVLLLLLLLLLTGRALRTVRTFLLLQA